MSDQASGWSQFEAEPAPAQSGWNQFEVEPTSRAATQPGYFDGAIKGTIDSLPAIGAVIGGAVGTPADVVSGPGGTVGGAFIGGTIGAATKNLINRYYNPAEAPKNDIQAVIDPLSAGATQASLQGAADFAAPYIAKGVGAATGAISDAANSVSSGLRGTAKQLVVKATGASGKDAAKFAPEVADTLLDKGVVPFGASPATVAKNTQAVMDAAEASKQVLINGPLKAATVDRNQIYNAIGDKISALSNDESKLGVVKQLESIRNNIASVGSRSGTDLSLSESENIRKGFDLKAKWNSSSDADVLEANKIAANVYRQAGENVAAAVHPAYGAQFKAAKNIQNQLIPVQEAAEKRALQLQQSPHGGLLDIAAVTGGAEVGSRIGEAALGDSGKVIGAAVGGGAGYVAKALRPRYAAMGAAMAKGASNFAGGVPAVTDLAAPAVEAMAPAALRASPASNAPTLGTLPSAAMNQSASNRSPAGPTTGPDAWAGQGLRSLGIQDPALSKALLADPKAKQLLIEASNYPAGSKQAKRILSQIKTGWGTP